jgi:prepilin signal peptidase PulO-like enzyme (type II secretory pathway)
MTEPGAAEWLAALPWAEAVTVVFAFWFGATVGSFLNVVAHRVPRGGSPVRGRSRCPACGASIRPRDNIPVVGWMLLGGRCRDCGTAIAATYPLVEAGCGLLLAAAALVELSGSGQARGWAGPALDRLLMRGDLEPLLAWVVRGGVLLTLVALALLDGRGHSVRWPTFMVVVGLVAAGVVAVPGLRPPRVDWGLGPASLGPMKAVDGSSAMAAVATGLAAGWLADALRLPGAVRRGSLLVGAALGWQGVILQVGLALTIQSILRLGLAVCGGPNAARAGSGLAWLAAALGAVLAWPWLSAG